MPEILLLCCGLVLLTVGAGALVRGASAIASRLGVSELAIGLTVVALGTSAPELAVSVKAALAGQGGIALGNVVGSNIFNVAAILGISALICPLAVNLKVVRQDMPICLVASVLFVALLMMGDGLVRWEGALLLTGLAAYLVHSFRSGTGAEPDAEQTRPAGSTSSLIAGLLVLIGLVLLVVGARVFVDNATSLARRLGVGEAIIGLTIVAAGTSLPELATSVVAALRRQTDIAIGNIVGSNIFNILGIAGATAVVRPIESQGIEFQHLAVMIATALVLLPLMRSQFRLVRWEGALLLTGYTAYLWMLWPTD